MKKRKLTPQQIKKFQQAIWQYYKEQGRDLPWRNTTNPYHILVSEIMLQQTQVERVKKYYKEFLPVFPNWEKLATAPLKKVLAAWQGMGYNRRALYLQRTAQIVVQEYQGKLPQEINTLTQLPGIGLATAGAIAAYSYNMPAVFIETNIRRVFIHQFFKNKKAVDDRHILPLIEQTLDEKNPCEWYWALMDYGAMLAKKTSNPNRKSKHYSKQSVFEGSRRQLRAKILKLLLRSPLGAEQLSRKIHQPAGHVKEIIFSLVAEGFIKENNNRYQIF